MEKIGANIIGNPPDEFHKSYLSFETKVITTSIMVFSIYWEIVENVSLKCAEGRDLNESKVLIFY